MCSEWDDFCYLSSASDECGQQIKETEELEKILTKIGNIPSGKTLYDALKKLYGEVTLKKISKIKIVAGNEGRFTHENMQVSVMLDEFHAEAVGSSKIVIGEHGMFRHVGSTKTTPDEMLFHELLHAKHYLEQETGKADKSSNLSRETPDRDKNFFARMKYYDARAVTVISIRDGERRNFPEIQKNHFAMWPSLEERRTVNGPDIDEICENTYRMDCGRPIRYIYQGDYNRFFEKEAVIFNYINDCRNNAVNDTSFSPDVDERWEANVKPDAKFDVEEQKMLEDL